MSGTTVSQVILAGYHAPQAQNHKVAVEGIDKVKAGIFAKLFGQVADVSPGVTISVPSARKFLVNSGIVQEGQEKKLSVKQVVQKVREAMKISQSRDRAVDGLCNLATGKPVEGKKSTSILLTEDQLNSFIEELVPLVQPQNPMYGSSKVKITDAEHAIEMLRNKKLDEFKGKKGLKFSITKTEVINFLRSVKFKSNNDLDALLEKQQSNKLHKLVSVIKELRQDKESPLQLKQAPKLSERKPISKEVKKILQPRDYEEHLKIALGKVSNQKIDWDKEVELKKKPESNNQDT